MGREGKRLHVPTVWLEEEGGNDIGGAQVFPPGPTNFVSSQIGRKGGRDLGSFLRFSQSITHILMTKFQNVHSHFLFYIFPSTKQNPGFL
jgi:hypothetical protein